MILVYLSQKLTEDSFTLYCLRCVLQFWVLWNAMTSNYDLLLLTLFGYEYSETDQSFRPKLMSISMAAPESLNDKTCNCTSHNETWSCFNNSQQPCTMACSCTENTQPDSMIFTNLYTLSSVFFHEVESSDDDDWMKHQMLLALSSHNSV